MAEEEELNHLLQLFKEVDRVQLVEEEVEGEEQLCRMHLFQHELSPDGLDSKLTDVAAVMLAVASTILVDGMVRESTAGTAVV